MSRVAELIDQSIVTDFPIEDIIQKLSEKLVLRWEGEPDPGALEDYRGLLWLAERGLEAILEVDSKCRPTDEWMAALNKVEAVRDETKETIEMLELI